MQIDNLCKAERQQFAEEAWTALNRRFPHHECLQVVNNNDQLIECFKQLWYFCNKVSVHFPGSKNFVFLNIKFRFKTLHEVWYTNEWEIAVFRGVNKVSYF